VAFFGDNRLFAIFDIDSEDEELDSTMRKLAMMEDSLRMTGEGFEMLGKESENTNDNMNDTNQQFGKMFGIGMNVLFLGMALNMVFGRMARNMLSMTGASAALGAAMKSVLLPFFLAITPHAIRLAQSMMELPRSVKMLIGAFVGLMAVLGPLLVIAGQVALLAISGLSLGMLATAAGVAAGALAILAVGFKAGAAIGNRFGDEIMFAMKVAQTIITRFVDTSVKMFNNFMSIIENVVGFFSNILTGKFGKAFQNLKNIASAAIDNITQILRLFFITDIAKMLAKFVEKAFDAGVNFVQNIADGIKSTAGQIMDAITSVLPSWAIEGLKMGVFGPAGFAAGAAMDVVGVNDFILSGDKLIKPDKRDTIVGAKPGGPIMSGGGGGEVTVNINDPVMKEDVDVQRVVDEVEDRVNRDTRGRTGLGT